MTIRPLRSLQGTMRITGDTTLLFYPTMTSEFSYGGVLERHAPGLLARTLRERTPILCLLDHDPAQVVGSLQAGTLRLVPERDGLRAELAHPGAGSSPGRERVGVVLDVPAVRERVPRPRGGAAVPAVHVRRNG
jgi:phage head maturation protease